MSKWRNVSKRHPCPVCTKDNWCNVAPDGRAVICRRIESARPQKGGGYHHWLRDPVPPPQEQPEREAEPPVEDWEQLQRHCFGNATMEAVTLYAGSLGVTPAALLRLGVGRHPTQGAWTFPFRDARANVIGIQMRGTAGRKWCVKGSNLGLFRATEPVQDRWLMICEGASDTAALMDHGFDAIGRPSCTACVDMVCEFGEDRDCVIVADNDGPGVDGARALVRALKRTANSVRMVRPQRKGSDVRGWNKSRAAWLCLIGNVRPL